MRALSRCKDPSWIAKRVVSLVVLGLVYGLFTLLYWAGHKLTEYLTDVDWTKIVCTVLLLFIVAANWYMVDDTIWD